MCCTEHYTSNNKTICRCLKKLILYTSIGVFRILHFKFVTLKDRLPHCSTARQSSYETFRKLKTTKVNNARLRPKVREETRNQGRDAEIQRNKVSRSSESDVIIDRPAQPLCNVRRVKVSGHVTSALRRLCGRSQHRRRARRQKHRTQPNCNSDSSFWTL